MSNHLSIPSLASRPHRQQGVTLLSFLIYALFGASLLLVCLRVVPIYMENIKLQSILAEVGESFTSEAVNKTSIKQKLSKRFAVNSVSALKLKDIKIEREGEFWVVDAGYEKRVNLVSNIDIIVNFNDDNKVQIPYSR